MTKELSKKLCEIVGIEQKYQLNGIGNTICSQKEIDEYSKKINYPEGAWVEIYPDFGKPENFVKLLEIYFLHNLLSDVGSIEDILKRIINSAELNWGLKRIIREAEWKYE